jgi:hypothetical protein
MDYTMENENKSINQSKGKITFKKDRDIDQHYLCEAGVIHIPFRALKTGLINIKIEYLKIY